MFFHLYFYVLDCNTQSLANSSCSLSSYSWAFLLIPYLFFGSDRVILVKDKAAAFAIIISYLYNGFKGATIEKLG